MTELDHVLHRAELALMQLVIDAHYAAGCVVDPARAAHLRALAETFNAATIELRLLFPVPRLST